MPKNDLSKDELLLNSELTRYGHTLGLSVNHTIASTKNEIQSEGNLAPLSMTILTELLDLYTQETNDVSMRKVYDIIHKQSSFEMSGISLLNAIYDLNIAKAYRSLIKIYNKNTYENQNFKTHNICLMPISAESHSFYLAYNEGYITLSNRGYSSFGKLGVSLYRIKPGMSEQLNRLNLSQVKFDTVAEYEEFFAQFAETSPSVRFEFKPQKIGHCSFANIKSLIKPLLYMQDSSIDYQAKYKDFTTWAREHEVKQLIKKYQYAKATNNKDFVDLYQKLITAYIERHCLKPSFLSNLANSAQGIVLGGILSVLGRKDIKHEKSNDSKLRLHNNIAIIYRELKNDPKFNAIFENITEEVQKLEISEKVMSDYDAIIPKRSELESIANQETRAYLGLKILILTPIIIIGTPFVMLAMAINALIRPDLKNDTQLVAYKTFMDNKTRSNFFSNVNVEKKKGYHRERKYMLHSNPTKIKNKESTLPEDNRPKNKYRN